LRFTKTILRELLLTVCEGNLRFGTFSTRVPNPELYVSRLGR
jgi:hypothetical protein